MKLPVSKPTANAEADIPAQPMQQVQAAILPKPVHYERNSVAIKMANNPLTSLVGLQEAAAAVLDEPVSAVTPHKGPSPTSISLLKGDGALTKCQHVIGALKRPQSLCCMQAELRWLDLSQCRLTSIQEELTRFPKLQMLYLHANEITKLNDVKKLGKLSGLQKLTLHGNPVAELPHYK